MATAAGRKGSGRLLLYGTRTVMIASVMGSPDHIHARQYSAGEQYVIGSYLMPQALSTRFVLMGKATEDALALSATEIARLAIAGHEFDRDGPETQAFDATDSRWIAFLSAYHRGT